MNWGVGKDWGQLHGGKSEAGVSQGDVSSGEMARSAPGTGLLWGVYKLSYTHY